MTTLFSAPVRFNHKHHLDSVEKGSRFNLKYLACLPQTLLEIIHISIFLTWYPSCEASGEMSSGTSHGKRPHSQRWREFYTLNEPRRVRVCVIPHSSWLIYWSRHMFDWWQLVCDFIQTKQTSEFGGKVITEQQVCSMEMRLWITLPLCPFVLHTTGKDNFTP